MTTCCTDRHTTYSKRNTAVRKVTSLYTQAQQLVRATYVQANSPALSPPKAVPKTTPHTRHQSLTPEAHTHKESGDKLHLLHAETPNVDHATFQPSKREPGGIRRFIRHFSRPTSRNSTFQALCFEAYNSSHLHQRPVTPPQGLQIVSIFSSYLNHYIVCTISSGFLFRPCVSPTLVLKTGNSTPCAFSSMIQANEQPSPGEHCRNRDAVTTAMYCIIRLRKSVPLEPTQN